MLLQVSVLSQMFVKKVYLLCTRFLEPRQGRQGVALGVRNSRENKNLKPRHQGAKKHEAEVLVFLCDLLVLCAFA